MPTACDPRRWRVAADRCEVLGSVRRLILATDMSRHADYMRELEALLPSGPCSCADLGRARRDLLAELVVKCADTSNVVKPLPVARRWAVRCGIARLSRAARPSHCAFQS